MPTTNQPDSQNRNGDTKLMRAVIENAYFTAARLIHSRVDVDARNNDGDTALVLSARDNRLAIFRELIDVAANLEITNLKGENALMVAAGEGRQEMVTRLVENHAKLDGQDQDGHTALMRAIIKGHEGTARHLVESGADLDIRAKDGRTALILATEKCNGFVELIELMLGRGADVSVTDAKGRDISDVLEQQWSYSEKDGSTGWYTPEARKVAAALEKMKLSGIKRGPARQKPAGENKNEDHLGAIYAALRGIDAQ